MEEAAAVSAKPAGPGASRIKRWLIRIAVALGVVLLIVAVGLAYLWFFQRTSHSAPVEQPKAVQASDDPVLDAIRRGVEFVRVRQEPDGHFSRGMLDPKPAFTAMVVDALARSPDKYNDRDHEFVRRAVKAILARQQPDGAICTPGFGIETYVTSVSVMALTALENPAHAEAIERAKKYLLTVQNVDEESPSFGGAGYNPKGRPSGDLTGMWVEALKNAGVKEDSDAFKNAQKFLQRLQNNQETNDKPAAGTAVGNDGGFYYRPGESPAGFETTKDGKKIPRSYGLMTYAALRSFLYMNVGKDDQRVQSAVRWVRDNYTLEENRNIGSNGLFYYYLTMAKALAAYGEAEIETADVRINWAQDMSRKLLALQRSDGSWFNGDSAKWMEDDPVLVTAFVIRTLSICHKELHKTSK